MYTSDECSRSACHCNLLISTVSSAKQEKKRDHLGHTEVCPNVNDHHSPNRSRKPAGTLIKMVTRYRLDGALRPMEVEYDGMMKPEEDTVTPREKTNNASGGGSHNHYSSEYHSVSLQATIPRRAAILYYIDSTVKLLARLSQEENNLIIK
ncbi:hypothetical protein CBL_08198 [Carabus blaptoides fortunei]